MTEPSDPSTVDVTVDLLNRPWIFSQRHLLTEKNFTDEAKRRGLFLSESGLEILHKHSVLVPLLRVERDLAGVRRELRRKQPSPWHWEILTGSPPTTAPGLAAEGDAGRVSEGSISSFEPWRRRRRRHKEVSYKAWDYLYSRTNSCFCGTAEKHSRFSLAVRVLHGQMASSQLTRKQRLASED